MQNSDTFGGYYSRTSARYPHYFEKVQRRRSYIDWPPEKQQTPDQLAEAGFYHAGPQDCTRCFYCGGGIKNWSPGDIPDVEHARWFSHCQYIISKKGQNFVNNVNINHPRHTETDGPKEEPKFEAKDFDDLIEKILKSSSGKALEILGYKADIIRAACARVLNVCAWDINSITTEALATEAIELEVKHRDSDPSEPEHLEGAVGGATGGHESAGNFVGASGVSSQSERHFSNPVAGEFHGDYAEDDAIGRIKLLRIEAPEQRAESGQRAAKGEVNGLSEKMSKLLVENRKLRDERTCKICLEKDVCVIFLPCRHLVTCEDCHSSLSKCPLCRGEIAAAVKAFM